MNLLYLSDQDYVTPVCIIADDARGMSEVDKQALRDLAGEHVILQQQLGAARTLLAEIRAENDAQRERLIELQKPKVEPVVIQVYGDAMRVHYEVKRLAPSWTQFRGFVK